MLPPTFLFLKLETLTQRPQQLGHITHVSDINISFAYNTQWNVTNYL